jgi:hypothetical protein
VFHYCSGVTENNTNIMDNRGFWRISSARDGEPAAESCAFLPVAEESIPNIPLTPFGTVWLFIP